MRVLLTGGSGFLGRHVQKRLAANGHSVSTYDNLDQYCGGVGCPDFNGDVTDLAFLKRCVLSGKIEAIVHLAAYGRNLTCQDFPSEAWKVNVDGTLNVLETASHFKIKRVVCCSSNIVLSPKPTMYRLTKETAERAVAYYQTLGLSALALRPSNICGPGQSKTEYQPCAMAGMDTGFEKNGYLSLSGDGTQTRDWIHAADVARAFGLALGSSYVGPTIDICTGKQTSLNEIAKMLGVPVKYTDPRPGDAMALISYPGAAKDKLAFEAKVPMVQIISDSFPIATAVHK